jgi:hypothetical protein
LWDVAYVLSVGCVMVSVVFLGHVNDHVCVFPNSKLMTSLPIGYNYFPFLNYFARCSLFGHPACDVWLRESSGIFGVAREQAQNLCVGGCERQRLWGKEVMVAVPEKKSLWGG